MLSKFAKKLRAEWRKFSLPSENETFIVAVSGGADSCALLFALHELTNAKKLKLNLIVAHFNHNLRGAESDADEKFVKETVDKLKFELVTGSPKSKAQSPKSKENLEQWARNARYDFLTETAIKNNACGILTAHTANDQAETFLLNLMRGSGADGLSAMRVVRDAETRRRGDAEIFKQSEIQNPKSKIRLVRPFLKSFSRRETENYCREKGIEFRHDAMNDDLNFSRVRVRKELLPLMTSFNPQIIEQLVNTAFLLQAENDELNEIAKGKFQTSNFKFQISNPEIQNLDSQKSLEIQNLKSKIQNPNELELKFLKSLSEVMRKRVLRIWLKEMRGDLRRLDAKHLQAIENLIFSEKSGKTVEFPNGEKIIKENGKLYFFSPND